MAGVAMTHLGRLGRAGLAALARHAPESSAGVSAELPWRHVAARAYSAAALPQRAEGVVALFCNTRPSSYQSSLFFVPFVKVCVVSCKLW